MKRVLVPTDGSETSLRAVNILIRERLRYGDPRELEIHLLNVRHSLSGSVNSFIDVEKIKQYHHEESLKALQPARDLLDNAAIAYKFHIGVGDPAQVITRYATELGIDEIIMGTHGRSELAGVIFGSVTREVVHLAAVPILLVK